MSISRIKLLIINSNTTTSVTQRMVAMAQARADAQIHGATARFGEPYISTRAAVAVAKDAARDALGHAMDEAGPFDAALYACFGEPGLDGVRRAAPFPVAGMAEASILTALQLGRRFGIVTVGAAWPDMLRELMQDTTLEARFAGFEVIGAAALAMAADREAGRAAVRAAIAALRAAHAPDVIIVGGAALAGYATELQAETPMPLVDSLAAGVEQALALARLGIRPVASA